MRAVIAGRAGILKLKTLNTDSTNMFVFKHPKFYNELRKKRKEFQKQQKLGEKAMKDEATSNKRQASSDKQQATSVKRQAPEQDSD
tara:strand:+ start:177 stop:434 length:258 start_codon:yes stop_codon:yes gene_type:complete